ncbi:Fic family protein [Paenibacillus turicensis]|uniref:Fic family protein n=1 Tax=Paenibacillus turicensis TaxID=160487 RepID=UPI003D2C0A7B
MEYQKLSKLYYKLDYDAYLNEIDKRKHGYSSYLTSLKIRGFKKGQLTKDYFELFYVNIFELTNVSNEVLINSSKISLLISKLPQFAVQYYFNKLIINEAQSTNEIEGIRSTKKELQEALMDVSNPQSKNNKRFKGLMKTYRYIDQINSFENVEDFRKLYDALVSDEINEEGTPDGKLFRANYVEINDGLKTTHIGLSNEQKIIEGLGALINYLNNSAHPPLYRYLVAHYYYEYIHPFYDGNGRTGRLIVGSYISRYLEKYTAITFSYAINKDKLKYYKALEEIPFPLNHGDMTFYLVDMLQLLATGQKLIIEDLEISLDKFERISQFFDEDRWTKLSDEQQVLFTMVTIVVFISTDTLFTLQSLMEMSQKSRHIMNKVMTYLLEEGYVKEVSKKPKSYQICEEFVDKILSKN